jgi:UDP-2,3-diacylglucosamine hydrolase
VDAFASAAPIELGGGDRVLFASDVHLGDHDPDTARSFEDALRAHAAHASHLFVLGDLFEAWVGDDGADEASRSAIELLAQLAGDGLRVYVMRGNRDFLLDVPAGGRRDAPSGSATHEALAHSFARRIGATMLVDPCTVMLFGRAALLAHGDAMCTDDVDYLRFRELTRSAAWQRDFLSRPLEERQAVARDLRARSELSKAGKTEELMDVNAHAVQAAMSEAGVRLLIHGHTHRPAHHALRIDGHAAERWVLPDWDARLGRGGMLLASADGFERLGRWAG